MKTINLDYSAWEPSKRNEQAPFLTGDSEDFIGLENGEPSLLQSSAWGQDPAELAELRRLLRFGVNFDPRSRARLSGILSSNEFFGTVPPQPARLRYACRDARLYEKHPEFKTLIDSISQRMWRFVQEHMPNRAAEQERIVAEHIHPDWRIGGIPFTSGIINDRSALPYHKDSGNLEGAWSMMLTLRGHIDGGGLHVPAYNVCMGTPDQSLTVFNGQGLWHGVTPLVYKKKDAYRFTLVWYVKSQICDCANREEEPHRAQRAATTAQDAVGTA